MRYLRAITLAGRAVTGYLGGWRSENEMRVMVNEACAMIGRPPVPVEGGQDTGSREET